MKHSKEKLILLLQTIIKSLDKSYDTLSQTSLEYIHSNLNFIHTILSSTDKSKINKEDDCDLTDLSESQLILKLNYNTSENNTYIDDLDDLID